MLLEAVNWRGEQIFTRDDVLREAKLAQYVTGWMREGDFGVIAEDETVTPMGAPWARTFPQTEPGYGFVAPGFPQLSLAVSPRHRGRGVGGALLEALIARARKRAAEGGAASAVRLSLSVENGNTVAQLYRACGFTVMGREGNSDTMLLRVA
jgi:ribosomal protein S18 acetylase RimI-like enzyme